MYRLFWYSCLACRLIIILEGGNCLKVLGKNVGLCKTTKRKDQLYIGLLVSVYGESSVKISTQTDSY